MDNEIHPTAIFEGQVELGEGNKIGPYSHIIGPVEIGNNNRIHSHAVIGSIPEIRNFDSQTFGVVIGDSCTIREAAQIHSGSRHPTSIGSRSFIMNQVYIAHDGVIGEDVTIASSALLAGGVTVRDFANIGMGTTVHQGRTIGALAMIGMGSVVTRDVPPAMMAFGNPSRIRRINKVGLQRFGFDKEIVESLEKGFVKDGFAGIVEIIGKIQPWDEKSKTLIHSLLHLQGDS